MHGKVTSVYPALTVSGSRDGQFALEVLHTFRGYKPAFRVKFAVATYLRRGSANSFHKHDFTKGLGLLHQNKN
jgi:hypothetical protein